MLKPPSYALLLLALLPAMIVGCDTQDEAEFEDAELRSIASSNNPLFQPYHGHWEGVAQQVEGNDYDATLMLYPGFFCSPSVGDTLEAQWQYGSITCTSELALTGVVSGSNGLRTWTFDDTNVSGPCQDGVVTLSETDEGPGVMSHTWSDLNGVLDAQGDLTRQSVCGP